MNLDSFPSVYIHVSVFFFFFFFFFLYLCGRNRVGKAKSCSRSQRNKTTEQIYYGGDTSECNMDKPERQSRLPKRLYDFFLTVKSLSAMKYKKKDSTNYPSWSNTACAMKFTDTRAELESLARKSMVQRSLKCKVPSVRALTGPTIL